MKRFCKLGLVFGIFIVMATSSWAEVTTKELIEWLHDEDWEVRLSAADRLGKIQKREAVTALLEVVVTSGASADEVAQEYKLRIAAAQSLGEIGDPYAISGLITVMKNAAYSRTTMGFTSRDYGVNDAAANALVTIGDEAMNALIEVLSETDVESAIRARAASALGGIGNVEVLPVLIGALKDQNDQVRWHAVQALGDLGDPQAIPVLIDHLRKLPNKSYSHIIANVLGKFADKQAVPVLLEALESENEKLREAAAGVLGDFKVEEAVPALIDLMKTEENKFTQYDYVRALGRIGSEQAITALIEAWKNEESSREIIIKALIETEDPRIKPYLLEAVDDENMHVRDAAKKALESMESTKTE